MTRLSPHDPVCVPAPRVAVIGAGVSGLTCAYRLHAQGIEVTVLEAAPRPGGTIASENLDGFILESGPNTYRRTLETEALTEALGLKDDYLPRLLRDYDRFIYDGARLVRAPTGPLSLLSTRLFSLGTKLRILREPFLRVRPPEEESVADFVRRHFGDEVLRKAAAPFVSGIYAGDPEKVSMKAAFPTIAGFARAKGSILRGAVAHFRRLGGARASGNPGQPSHPKRPPSALCSYREGLAQLPQALAASLAPHVLCGHPVGGIEPATSADGRPVYRVMVRDTSGRESVREADGLVIAVPAYAAADLVRTITPDAVPALRGIPYTPVAVAHVGTSEESLGVRPGGFGFLVVRGCAVRALGVLYSSSMFREHAPPGQVLLTMFYGGATDPGLIEIGDTALIEALRKDLAQTMRWDGRSQVLRITRHHAALPAYHLGHLERVRQIESAAAACPAPVRFVGNYLRGISIADCIRQAGMAADDLRERLTR